MFKSNFFLNPIRKKERTKRLVVRWLYYPLKQFIVRVGVQFGFMNIDYAYVHGNKNRIHLGEECSTMNSIFNVISGEIWIGNNTILGHNCMLLTGTHTFINGKRASLMKDSNYEETPSYGRDIIIGEGCFIGSGVTIIGPVSIGNDVIIGAGSVVIKSIPDSCFAAGVPAVVMKNHNSLES